MISLDQELYDFVKAEKICLSKQVQLMLQYQKENKEKK
jgi:hypothetical protein